MQKCKWSCPVESYIVGECNCTWGADEIKEELQALDMDGNIIGEDFAEWSEYDDIQEVHSIHDDTTEGEMTGTSSDDMPTLIDAAEDSDNEEDEVPALPTNVVLSMPDYPTSTEICTTYLDDIIQNDNITTSTNINNYDICVRCNLPYTPPEEAHIYECDMHRYCNFHNRWEGPKHGHIRCDVLFHQHGRASRQQPKQLQFMAWDKGQDPW